jgi:hypothetical protein
MNIPAAPRYYYLGYVPSRRDERDFSLDQARVHFIPDLKVGVFVTLRAPDVINNRVV